VTITTNPLLTLNFELPPQCIFNTSSILKLTTQVLNITLQNQYALAASTKQLISSAKATTQEMNSASTNAFMANNMIPSGASFAFRCLVSMDSITFLKFFLIDYPPNVLAMFQTKLPTSDILPDVILDEDPRDGSLPDIFETYEVSIYVFNNCGNEVIEMFAYIMVGVIAIILNKCFFRNLESKSGKVLLILLRMIFVWNFSMSNILSSFMTLCLYTFLAYRFPVSTTTMGKFNLVFSLFMGLLLFSLLVFVFLTIRKLRPFIVAEVLFTFQNFIKNLINFFYKKLETKKNDIVDSATLTSPSISSPKVKRLKTNKVFIEENSSRKLHNPKDVSLDPSLPPNEEVSFALDKNKNEFLPSIKKKNPTTKTKVSFDETLRRKEEDLTPDSGKGGKFIKKSKRNNNDETTSVSIVDVDNSANLGEPKTDINLSSMNTLKTMRNTSREKSTTFIERLYSTLISFEKTSAAKFKKKELVMDKINGTAAMQRATEKIGFYFHHKDKSEIAKVENVGENPLDWRLNNDYRDHATLKVISSQWGGFKRSFYCLHKDFGHGSLFNSYFLIFDLCRQILFSICIICFYDNAFFGMVFINAINITYLIVLTFVRPFRERIDQVQNFVNEILVLVIGASILYMAFMEKYNRPDADMKLKLGWTVVFTNAMLIVIFMMRMIWNLSKFGFLMLKLLYIIIKMKFVKTNQVENLDPANKNPDNKKKGDVLQQFIEIQNFLS